MSEYFKSQPLPGLVVERSDDVPEGFSVKPGIEVRYLGQNTSVREIKVGIDRTDAGTYAIVFLVADNGLTYVVPCTLQPSS